MALPQHHPVRRYSESTVNDSSFLCFEDNLLYLHLIEDVVTFHSLAQRHDLIGHEPVVVSTERSLLPL